MASTRSAMEDVTNDSRLPIDAPSSKREKLSHEPLRALSLEKAETMPALKLRVKRIVAHTADHDAVKRSKVAKLPKRGSAGAAGYDLASAEDVVVPKRNKAVVRTGLSIAIPSGTYARIAPRSGLAVKHFVDTGAGVVDEDYRGEVGVVLFNHGDEDFNVKAGDRVAQLILERIVTPEVEEVENLDETVRGAGGYGSTGTASV